jgi:tRNA threonylcarbamoyladenosine biosynthesis protein TsaE
MGPPERSGRPLSPSWWVPGAVYAVAYAAGALATMIGGSHLLTREPPNLTEVGMSGCCCGALCLEPVLLCHLLPLVSARWLARVVIRPTPRSYLLVAGLASGCIAGAGFWGLTYFARTGWQQPGLLAIYVAGPLPGILWLLHRPETKHDGDYDDEMEPVQPDIEIDLPNLAATEALGRRLGRLLFPNAVVALIGPLGAGKTHLARAIAEGLGIANPAAVTSPTFTLIHEHPARLPIYHFDAYRLNGPNEFLDLGVSEYYEAGGVCLIEWADKVEAALPAERLTIRLVPVDENRRRAEVGGIGEKYEALARELASGAA